MNTVSYPLLVPAEPAEQSQRVGRQLERLALVAAAAAILVGVLVIIGWYLEIAVLTRVAPMFVAMQYNTAVAFVFAGVSLAALVRHHRAVAVTCAVIVLAIGVLTLLEHLFGWNVGIDEMLWALGVNRERMGELANIRQSAPGRMAPNSTVCFSLFGAGALVSAVRGRQGLAEIVAVSVAAMLTATFAAVALSGYLIGVPTAFGWGNLTRMAVHTAAVMTLLGIGLLAHAMRDGIHESLPLRSWFPALAGVAVSVATLMMWQALVEHDRRSIETTVRREAMAMANAMERGLDERSRVTERLSARLLREGSITASDFAFNSALVVRDYTGLSGLAYVDAAGIVRQSLPERALGVSVGTPFGATPLRAELARAAARRAAPTLSPPEAGRDGAMQALIMTPIVGDGGSYVAVLDYRAFVSETVADDLAGDYTYVIRDGGQRIAERRRDADADSTALSVVASATRLGRTWDVTLVPTARALDETSSAVPRAFLVAGFLGALFASLVVRSALRASEQSRRLALVVNELAAENEARRRAELVRDVQAAELQQQARELELQNATLQETASEMEEQREVADRAEEFRAALVRAAVDGVAAFDSAGTVNAWNPAMAAIAGHSGSDVAGRMVGALLPFLPPGEETRLVAEALAGRATHVEELSGSHPVTGAPVWLDVSVSPMRALDGHVVGGLLVARDVTERKRVADLVLASKESAEAANRAKSEFLARMSHELRTPLNAVIGFTNVLKRDRDHRLSQNDHMYLDRISANGRHLLSLINEVLDLSKIEAGHETIELASTDVAQLVRETAGELEIRATEARVRLSVAVPEHAIAVTDGPKIKQVLINLIGNAIKFTGERGRVCVRVVPAAADAACAIEVSDTGIGIPADRLDAIFQAFEQADEQTSRKYGGTGLGLAISRKLCALMGHDLTVRSTPGEGSVFTIQLRREATADQTA